MRSSYSSDITREQLEEIQLRFGHVEKEHTNDYFKYKYLVSDAFYRSLFPELALLGQAEEKSDNDIMLAGRKCFEEFAPILEEGNAKSLAVYSFLLSNSLRYVNAEYASDTFFEDKYNELLILCNSSNILLNQSEQAYLDEDIYYIKKRFNQHIEKTDAAHKTIIKNGYFKGKYIMNYMFYVYLFDSIPHSYGPGQAAMRSTEFAEVWRDDFDILQPIYSEFLIHVTSNDCDLTHFKGECDECSDFYEDLKVKAYKTLSWGLKGRFGPFKNSTNFAEQINVIDYINENFAYTLARYSAGLVNKAKYCSDKSIARYCKGTGKMYDVLLEICDSLPLNIILNEDERKFFDDDIAIIKERFEAMQP